MRIVTCLSLLAAVLVLTACHDETLLSNLSEQQANTVVALLQKHGVASAKQGAAKTGYQIAVDHVDFPAAVDLIQTYDLPAPPDVEISQAFPADSLISTPQAEKARLISYIEQRLSANLSSLSHVVRARVNVSYPVDQDQGNPHGAMHASVLIVYSDDVDTQTLISEVKRYVKNSFNDIDYNDVSVLAQRQVPVFRAQVAAPSTPTFMFYQLGTTLTALFGLSILVAAVFLFRMNKKKLS